MTTARLPGWRPPHSAPTDAALTNELHHAPPTCPRAPHLPPEVIAIIFVFLQPSSPPDLARYARVSRAWLSHARVALYRSISLRVAERDDAANGWLAMPADATADEIEARMVDCVARPAALLARTVAGPGGGAVAELVGALEVAVANDGHVFEIEPVAQVLGTIRRSCGGLSSLKLTGATARQSDALLAAFATAAHGLARPTDQPVTHV